ncbi:MAG: hypothetical protein ABI192_03215 [Bradyrhizobium sp.]
MSEQAEQTSGDRVEPIVPHSSDVPVEPVTAAAEAPVNAESPGLVPEQSASSEAPEVSAAHPEAAKETAKDTPKADAPRIPGKVLIMSSADRDWANDEAGPELDAEPSQGMFGKRRLAALAAVVALAALAGALGGATATIGLQHFAGNDAAPAAANSAADVAVARIDTDIVALKASVEHTSKMSVSQFNKTSDRLDKVERAQVEPAAKLAKLSEQVEKLRVTPSPVPVAAAAPALAKEVTGSVTPAVTTAAAPKPAEVKTEVGRLPTVEGWTLRDVANGGALIEGRQGIYEVYAGDPVPGLGRVDAIRRQDGHWVVVTSKGLIVAR